MAEIDNLKIELAETRTQLTEAWQANENLNQRLNEASEKIGDFHKQISEIATELDETYVELERVSNELAQRDAQEIAPKAQIEDAMWLSLKEL